MISPPYGVETWETIELASMAPPTQRREPVSVSRPHPDTANRSAINGGGGATGPPFPGATSK